MNQTIESNTQGLKLDTFKNIKKIGLKEILKSQESISQTISTIDKILREKDENGKDLYETNNKLWHEIVMFNHDLDNLVELKTLYEKGKLKTIYTQYLSNRSDDNGNHGQITMQYGHVNELGVCDIYSIRLHCLGVKETKNGFVYLRHGGNYSFEHDVVSSLNYFLFGNSEGFKQESL